MEETGKKNSYVSRILAVAALIAAAVVLVAVVSANTGGGGDEKKGKANPTRQANKPKTKAKVYKVEEGDNLTIISQKTGISVERIEALNPDLDPQALQPGQKIKLR
jgi:LysM repeat protein